MNWLKILSLSVVGTPLFSALVVGFLNKRITPKFTNWLACVMLACSFIASSIIFVGLACDVWQTTEINFYIWGSSGSLQIPVGFLLDRLSAIMIMVVTFVSFMVHIYSIGYMQDDPGYQRFFCYISFFTFAMLMLVLANNLAQLFFGWEGVGLVSYLLIGFWFKKDSATYASLKAFLINRIGDLGFVVGIAACLYYFNSLQYSDIFNQVTAFAANNPTLNIFANTQISVISFTCFCLFIGAMAKSAQVPLHVWLPDSMEGPTPISALIHAATMVTAGIFMVARMSPLFEHSETILSFMLLIGSVTCLLMGLLAIVQSDIKRIVAYSTLSQLGYMVVALGASAYSVAIFHLFTHAFFKALLFLAAGSAIIAMHHKQNIFEMGNLRKYMPISFATTLIGGLALIGFPGTAGFYSKDLIILAARHSKIPVAEFAYTVTLATVLLTTLYTFRMIYLVFFGSERMSDEIKAHLHESPKVVTIPLLLLAIPSLMAGFIFVGPILQGFFEKVLFVLPEHSNLALYMSEEYKGPLHMLAHGFISWPFACIVTGFILVWLCYIKYPTLPSVLEQDAKPIYKILLAKFGFDALNEKIIMPCVRAIGDYSWRVIDMFCIDGIIVNGSASAIMKLATELRNIQSGYLYHYVFMLVAGLLGLLVWILYL